MNQAPGTVDKIIMQAVKSGRPIPEALSGPVLHPWLELFYVAFTDLMADRPNAGALIPWAVRQHWAEVHGLDSTATRLLHIHIKAMDIAFLEWKRSKEPKPPAPPDP